MSAEKEREILTFFDLDSAPDGESLADRCDPTPSDEGFEEERNALGMRVDETSVHERVPRDAPNCAGGGATYDLT